MFPLGESEKLNLLIRNLLTCLNLNGVFTHPFWKRGEHHQFLNHVFWLSREIEKGLPRSENHNSSSKDDSNFSRKNQNLSFDNRKKIESTLSTPSFLGNQETVGDWKRQRSLFSSKYMQEKFNCATLKRKLVSHWLEGYLRYLESYQEPEMDI